MSKWTNTIMGVALPDRGAGMSNDSEALEFDF